MATKPKSPARPSTVNGLTPIGDTDNIPLLEASYVCRTFRFLFDDGAVVDVVGIADDSDLRQAVLNYTAYDGIVGVAIVEGSDE